MNQSPSWESNCSLPCVQDYMIIKVSFLLVASVAALKISRTKISSPTKRNATTKSPGIDSSHLDHQFGERENSTANANHVIQNEEEKQIKIEISQNLLTGDFGDTELLIGGDKMDNATEKEILQNIVQNYKKREVNLERKLLELNGLKEEQSAIAQLQMQLKSKIAKLDSLKVTIASLQAENKTIGEKIREGVLSKKQLDIARKMINEMQRKKDDNGSPVKEQLLMLQQQVTELQKYNSSGRNAIVNKKVKDLQGIELEALELKRRNKELELEKREIVVTLAAAHSKVRTEEETMDKIKEEITGLRHVHEELSEQVERLQRNRLDMVQELVYQRWLYTCLRFEVINHQKQSRKASIQVCSHNSSKELHGKTNALTSDPELDSISSNTTLDESDEMETTTLDSSSSSQSSSSRNSSLLSKMKRWKKTKHGSKEFSSKGRNSPRSTGLIRRFSTSMIPSDLSMPRNGGDSPVINLSQKSKMPSSSTSLEKPIMPRLKRVSFSDSVKASTYKDMPEAAEDVINDKETRPWQNMELTSSTMDLDKHEANEKYDKPSYANECAVCDPIKNNTIAENEGTKNKICHSDELNSRNELVCGKDDRTKIRLVVQLVALFFFSLILLAYFMIN